MQKRELPQRPVQRVVWSPISREESKPEVTERPVQRLALDLCQSIGTVLQSKSQVAAPSASGRNRHGAYQSQAEDIIMILQCAGSLMFEKRVYIPRTAVQLVAAQSCCAMCFDTPIEAGAPFKELSCKHRFHSECFDEMFALQLQGTSFPISCPKCNRATSMADWENHYTPEQLQELGKIARLHFLNNQAGAFATCPTDKCPMIFNAEEVRSLHNNVFECPCCMKKSCIGCGIEYHEDMTCETYRNWRQQIEESRSKDQSWISSMLASGNWRQCPVCAALLEKVDGCNYVVCSCRTALCWATGKTRATCGGGHNCH